MNCIRPKIVLAEFFFPSLTFYLDLHHNKFMMKAQFLRVRILIKLKTVSRGETHLSHNHC